MKSSHLWGKFKGCALVRTLLAAGTPFLALILQNVLWPFVQPFFWFAFYWAVLVSATIGGFASGVLATFISVLLGWYFFVPPYLEFSAAEPKYYLTAGAFALTGILISILNGRLRKVIQTQGRIQAQCLRRETQMLEAQRIGHFGSWAWDIKKNQIEWSDETFRIFGMTPSKQFMTYEDFLSFVPEEDRDFVKEATLKAMTSTTTTDLDHRIILKDGTEKIVHEVADMYLDRKGQPSLMIGTVHDITERKKVEEAFKESESKFRGLLETACDPIIVTDARGVIEFANGGVRTTFGYEPSELLGQPVEILIPDRFKTDHIGRRLRYFTHPVSRPMGKDLQLTARKKDGSEIPIDISLSPYNTKRGQVVTAFIRDMSESKRNEAQQKFLFDTTRILSETMNYEERIQRLADLIVPPLADICLVHTLEGGHLGLSAIAQREDMEFGLARRLFANGHLTGENIPFGPCVAATSHRAQLVVNVNDQVLRQISGGDELFFSKIKRLNIQSWISVPMLARGRNLGVISLIRCQPRSYSERDLNLANLVADRAALAVDNARLYREAQNAIQLREDILAVVSHDLKNPLGVIRGFNEVLGDTLQKVGADKTSVEAIGRSVKQMERLIGDLLDFAKIQSGTLSIEKKDGRVAQLIQDGLETVRHHLDKKGIRIILEIEAQDLAIVCDEDRIRQVFSNILENAIKFSPENEDIRIRVEKRATEIVFSVCDRGPGILKENLLHLFDRYWQAKESAKSGTAGLGLSIAKGIIEGHGGRIWAESQVGEGTTFYFTLPHEG